MADELRTNTQETDQAPYVAEDAEEYPWPPPLFDAGNIAETVDALLDSSKEHEIRSQAAWAIANHRYLPGLEALISIARDSNAPSGLRMVSINALGEFHEDAALQTLIGLLD